MKVKDKAKADPDRMKTPIGRIPESYCYGVDYPAGWLHNRNKTVWPKKEETTE